MSLEENRQQYAKHFSSGRNGGTDQWVEIGDSVEDKTLTNGTADGKFHDLVHDNRVLQAVLNPRGELAQEKCEDTGSQSHVEICPEHEVIGFGFHASSLGLRLKTLLNTSGDSIAGQGKCDEDKAKRRGGRARLALAHGHDRGADDDRQNGGVFSPAVLCTSKKKRTFRKIAIIENGNINYFRLTRGTSVSMFLQYLS